MRKKLLDLVFYLGSFIANEKESISSDETNSIFVT